MKFEINIGGKQAGGGIGFASLLTIVFIYLKLRNFIGWPWLWVLSPIWISAGLAILFILIGLFIVWINSR